MRSLSGAPASSSGDGYPKYQPGCPLMIYTPTDSSFLAPPTPASLQYLEPTSPRSTPKTKHVSSYARRDSTRIQKPARRKSSSSSPQVLRPQLDHDIPLNYTSPPPETPAPDTGRPQRLVEMEEDGLIDAEWLESPLSDYFDRQDEDEQKSESIIVLQRRGTKEVLSPKTWLDEWLLDPFRSFVRPMTPYMQRLMLQCEPNFICSCFAILSCYNNAPPRSTLKERDQKRRQGTVWTRELPSSNTLFFIHVQTLD